MGNLAKHLKTIRTHRKYVRKSCWKMGLFWQGITHDLSKYSRTELSVAKYYTGKGSPHDVCRAETGYSESWLHHKYRNKHHSQHWLDDDVDGNIVPIKMPYKYVVEMLCDFIGAGKAYEGKRWTCESPLNYWNKCCVGKRIMHKKSEELLVKFLIVIYDHGEKAFYKWYRKHKKEIKENYERN